MATDEQWEQQQDEDVDRVVAPRPMDADLLRHYQDARGDSLDRLRAVYDLGRQHGAAANSKPTPNFPQIRSSAPAGGLVELVRSGILAVEDDDGEDDPSFKYTSAASRIGQGLIDLQACAAIRAVADWLEQRRAADAHWITVALLREEAGR